MLGDEYVKSEFRAHRNVENPVHIVCIVYGGKPDWFVTVLMFILADWVLD